MKHLNSICLLTSDVRGLSEFYQRVLEVAAEGDDDFTQLPTPGAQLTIFSTQGLEALVPGLAQGAGAGGCFLEFEVKDVDQEYARLQGLQVDIVKPPTTQPWGVRSVWFRDPVGNSINFYARVQ